MWFYLYIVVSKKRAQRLFEREWKRFGNVELEKKPSESRVCVGVSVCAGIPNFVEEWCEWVRNWPSCTYSRSCEWLRELRVPDPFKFETRWSLNGNTGKRWKMIEQNVKNEIEKGVKQNNQGSKLLVVWIWSDGTNDERARGVLKKARINQP